MKRLSTISILILLTLINFSITELQCGETSFPGCKKCKEDVTKGCSECEENTRYIEKDGLGRCEVFDSSLKCGKTLIPGCDYCADDKNNGCVSCVRGAGVIKQDGYGYCTFCMKNCEICEETDEGRQCQKCFDGFKFNQFTQECFGALNRVVLYFIFFLVFCF